MKNLTAKIIFIFLVGIIFNASAASLTKQEQKALTAFSQQKYSKALNMYLELAKVSEDKSKYDYMIGMAYLSSDDKIKALPYLESAKTRADVSFVVYYYLGRAYMYAQRFDEAMISLQIYSDHLACLKGFRFSKVSKVNKQNKVHVEKTITDVNNFIETCKNQAKNPANTVAEN